MIVGRLGILWPIVPTRRRAPRIRISSPRKTRKAKQCPSRRRRRVMLYCVEWDTDSSSDSED
jgi:hypothetical protein